MAAASLAMATVKTERVTYTQGGTVLEGVVAYDDSVTTPRPGVMIVHDWNGLDEYEIGRARQLAEMGYVALAVDIYGKGVRPKNQAESAAEAGKYYQNNALFRARLTAGLDALRAQKGVDSGFLVAMGYCFGGTGVVELARTGADLRGAVSFHGGLAPGGEGASSGIRAKLLLVHAIDDPVVPRASFNGFLDELSKNKVDFQAVVYNLATHAFTVPGAMYNADADRRSWAALRAFLAEVAPIKSAG